MAIAARNEKAMVANLDCGLGPILKVGLESALAARMPSNDWSVDPITEIGEINQEEFVCLTVSSYHFRILVLLHFTAMGTALPCVAEAIHQSPETLSRDSCLDYLAELGNQFCGEIKRMVGLKYPEVGMSTPMRLEHTSLPYMQDLKTCATRHALVRRNGQAVFAGSLYLCSDEGFQFHLDSSLAVGSQVQASALELF